MDKVLITGVSRGLGLAITGELLEAGYGVIGIARSRTSAIEELQENFPDQFAFQDFDLSEVSLIKDLASELHKKHGRFYGLVNNAGIGSDGILATMHEKDIANIYNINLLAPTFLCKYISRGMLANRRGRIINISSIIASTGFSGLAAYGASKAGLLGLTKSLSRELGKAGINVNCISPGYLETEMTVGLKDSHLESIRRRSPFNRFPTVGEVAKSVKFLLSEDGSGIHGTNLTIDLGSTA